jgi:hypothetical protein
MEAAQVHRAAERLVVVGGEPDHQRHRDDQLDRQAHRQHAVHDPPHVAQTQRLRLRLHGQLHPQPDPAGDQQPEQRRQGHDPDPADLDQHEDHDLAERGPVGGGVHHDQPGHAHRGHRGEHRRREPGPGPALRRDRQGEQHRAGRDRHREPGHDRRGRPPQQRLQRSPPTRPVLAHVRER